MSLRHLLFLRKLVQIVSKLSVFIESLFLGPKKGAESCAFLFIFLLRRFAHHNFAHAHIRETAIMVEVL